VASFIWFDIREKSWEGQKENTAYSKHVAFLYRRELIFKQVLSVSICLFVSQRQYGNMMV